MRLDMKLGLRWNRATFGTLIALTLLLGSCAAAETPIANEAPPAAAPPPVTTAVIPSAEEMTVGLPRLEGTATAEIKVGSKVITVELDGDKAPVTAGNFVDLAQKGVYDGTIFHRVVRSPEPFVAQGGDPQSTDPSIPINRLGTGGYQENGRERTIPLEILPVDADEPVYGQTFPEAGITVKPVLDHKRGAIAMARSGVNTASSQFYITLADVAFLDGNYAVFGYVTDGMDVVDDIRIEDVIQSVTITAGSDNLVTADAAEPDTEPAAE
ncbi:MAG: peptidylprolyl isomerase [Cyanobacteria bacterium P01_D01_bin.36]